MFLTFTPKILRSEEKKKENENENSETIIINIIILKSNYSEMEITAELIVDNSFHVLKIKGSKKKLFLSNNYNQCEIIKDEKDFILIKVEFLKTTIA